MTNNQRSEIAFRSYLRFTQGINNHTQRLLCSTFFCHFSFVQEAHNLCAGAGKIWAKEVVSGTGGYLFRHRPCHSLCIICIGAYIIKACRINDWASCFAMQEYHGLTTGEGHIRTKGGRGGPTGHAFCHCPTYRISIICILRNVHKRQVRFYLRTAVGTPEEYHHLRTGARHLWREEIVCHTGYKVLLCCPKDRLIEVVGWCNVRKRIVWRRLLPVLMVST